MQSSVHSNEEQNSNQLLEFLDSLLNAFKEYEAIQVYKDNWVGDKNDVNGLFYELDALIDNDVLYYSTKTKTKHYFASPQHFQQIIFNFHQKKQSIDSEMDDTMRLLVAKKYDQGIALIKLLHDNIALLSLYNKKDVKTQLQKTQDTLSALLKRI